MKIGNIWGAEKRLSILQSVDLQRQLKITYTGFVRFSCLYKLKSNLLSRPSRHSLPVFGHVELCQLGSYLSQFHSRLETKISNIH